MAHDPATYSLRSADGRVIAPRITVADTMGRRGLGLMFRRSLDPEEGIVIRPCSSIHMFFMRFAIDVVFVDRDGRIVHICDSIRPWRMSKPHVRGAKAAIEIAPGLIRANGVGVGDVVSLVAEGG